MKKKIAETILLFVGLAVLAVGCAKEKEKELVKTAEETEQEPVTFDWYVNYSWFAMDWGQNVVSKEITKETGVDINFIMPSGNESEKLNTLIASESLPDLITLGWWEPQVNTMIEQEMVYPLNELADQYDVYFWEVSDPQVVNWYTQEDGNIYGYPNSCCTPEDVKKNDKVSSNQTFLVRKDIYEAIGSPDMTTPEGFADAVRKAKEMFPEVDGKPLIPIGGHPFGNEGNISFDKHLMNFLAVPFEQDGKLYDRYTDPDYITWLKMFRELGTEGLLADDIFIDQRSQIDEKIQEGRYFCMIYQYADMLDQQKIRNANDPESVYMAVDGPKNSRGDDHTLTTTGINGWTITMISKNCKHPDRAIQFMDYLMSEHGQKLLYLGVEGATYDMVDGKPIVRAEVNELLNSDRSQYDKKYGADDAYWMLQNNIMQLQWEQEQEQPEAVRQLKEWSHPYVIYNGQYDSILQTDSREENEDAKITELWGNTLPELLLAPSEEEFDRIFAEFLEKREAYGYEDVMNKKTELMDEAKEKLGL